MGMMSDITAKYSGVEALVYDAVVAPAVANSFLEGIERTGLLEEMRAGARVLDVGCGGGQILLALAQRFGDVRFTGLDLSEAQIRRARGRVGALANIEFVVGDALRLPFGDEHFDAIISVACIKHWPDKARGLSECFRTLKPGGKMVLVEADRGFSEEDVTFFASRWRLPDWFRSYGTQLFKRHITGRSITMEEAGELFRALDWHSLNMNRIAGQPAFIVRSRK